MTSRTTLTLTLNTIGATPGPRTLAVANPDGQTSTLAAALLVGSGVNHPPVFGIVRADRGCFTVGGAGSTGPLAFTVSYSDGGAVTMSATTSNPAVAPVAGLVLGGSGTNRTVSVGCVGHRAPRPSRSTAELSGLLTSSTAFEVTVGPSSVPGPPLAFTATVIRNVVVFDGKPPASAATASRSPAHRGSTPAWRLARRWARCRSGPR